MHNPRHKQVRICILDLCIYSLCALENCSLVLLFHGCENPRSASLCFKQYRNECEIRKSTNIFLQHRLYEQAVLTLTLRYKGCCTYIWGQRHTVPTNTKSSKNPPHHRADCIYAAFCLGITTVCEHEQNVRGFSHSFISHCDIKQWVREWKTTCSLMIVFNALFATREKR